MIDEVGFVVFASLTFFLRKFRQKNVEVGKVNVKRRSFNINTKMPSKPAFRISIHSFS